MIASTNKIVRIEIEYDKNGEIEDVAYFFIDSPTNPHAVEEFKIDSPTKAHLEAINHHIISMAELANRREK